MHAAAGTPLEVTYDQLDRRPAETVAMVLHALGLPNAGVTVPSRLARQRDEISQAWIERYRRERAGASAVARHDGARALGDALASGVSCWQRSTGG